MDFRPLYRPDRHLFAIGFNLVQGRLDNACYDLLASECCLTSYLAVARGEAPRRHWFQLGRPFIRAAGRIGLISWGGTMFEYLMPRLLAQEPARHPAGRGLPHRRRPADRVRPQPGPALGDLRIGLRRPVPRRRLPVPGLRRPGPGAQAGTGAGPGHRALCDGHGHDARAPRGPGELPAPRPRKAPRGNTASTRRSTTPPIACPRGSDRSSSGRTWPTTRG